MKEMEKTNYHIINEFNVKNKTEKEIKEIFNKKFLKVMYELEKMSILVCENPTENVIMKSVENTSNFAG